MTTNGIPQSNMAEARSTEAGMQTLTNVNHQQQFEIDPARLQEVEIARAKPKTAL